MMSKTQGRPIPGTAGDWPDPCIYIEQKAGIGLVRLEQAVISYARECKASKPRAGGFVSRNFGLVTPSGVVFFAYSLTRDVDRWRAVVTEYAETRGLRFANLVEDALALSDGSKIPLSICSEANLHSEWSVPGKIPEGPGRRSIYIEEKEGKHILDTYEAFGASMDKSKLPRPKDGTFGTRPCEIETPDGSLFYAFTITRDLQSWSRFVDEFAKSAGVRLAKITDGTVFQIDDGTSIPLADCTIRHHKMDDPNSPLKQRRRVNSQGKRRSRRA